MILNKNLYFALVTLVLLSLSIVFYRYNPVKYGFFPRCPFFTLTGYDCPGCGSQRAIHSLLHGKLEEAVRYNMLLVLSIPFLVIHFFYKIKAVILKKDIRWAVIYHPLTPKVIFVVVMLFWITRNIPFYPFNVLYAGH